MLYPGRDAERAHTAGRRTKYSAFRFSDEIRFDIHENPCESGTFRAINRIYRDLMHPPPTIQAYDSRSYRLPVTPDRGYRELFLTREKVISFIIDTANYNSFHSAGHAAGRVSRTRIRYSIRGMCLSRHCTIDVT